MMSRITSILVLSVYFLLSIGVAKSTHFCMGRAHHSSLFSFETKKCACLLYQKNQVKNCCKDETELIKIENDQVNAIATDIPKIDGCLLAVLPFVWQVCALSDSNFVPVEPYNPPPPKVPIYQLGCSWKIDDLIA